MLQYGILLKYGIQFQSQNKWDGINVDPDKRNGLGRNGCHISLLEGLHVEARRLVKCLCLDHRAVECFVFSFDGLFFVLCLVCLPIVIPFNRLLPSLLQSILTQLFARQANAGCESCNALFYIVCHMRSIAQTVAATNRYTSITFFYIRATNIALFSLKIISIRRCFSINMFMLNLSVFKGLSNVCL